MELEKKILLPPVAVVAFHPNFCPCVFSFFRSRFRGTDVHLQDRSWARTGTMNMTKDCGNAVGTIMFVTLKARLTKHVHFMTSSSVWLKEQLWTRVVHNNPCLVISL